MPEPSAVAQLFAGSRDLFLQTDGQGLIVAANAAWAGDLGWPVKELVGRPFAGLVHPDDRARLGSGEVLRLATASGGWLPREERAASFDGWGALTIVFRPEPEGAPTIRRLLSYAGVWGWTYEVETGRVRIGGDRSTFLGGPPPDASVWDSLTFDMTLAAVHNQDREGFQTAVERVLAEGGQGSAEFRMRNLEGEWRRLRTTFESAPGPNGRPVIYGATQDITLQWRARDEALLNAERLRIALNAAGAAVCEVDFRTSEVWTSEQFVGIVGTPLTFAAQGEEPWQMCHPEDRHLLLQPTWQEDRHPPIQLRMIHPSGEVRWVEMHGEREVDGEGRLTKIIALVLDIDERRRQELALASARRELMAYAERLKLAMDASGAGVFEANFAAESFWCSPEFVEIVGRPLTYAESLGVWPMVHPEDAPRVQAEIERVQTIADSVANEWRIVRPDGQVRWVEARGLIHRNAEGRGVSMTGVVLDIEARKRQELALIEAQRSAEAATEAKSQFLANMSHEIRTPMNGVLGVLQLLDKEPMSPEGRQLLGEAASCGQMLAQLLNDVIDVSRIEAGKLELLPEPIRPADVLKSVADLLRPQAEAKGLELLALTQGDAHAVLADPVRLRQALFNLIGNAVKFTEAGKVEARLICSGAEDGRRRLRFEIEDTGVGIPEEAQSALFQRFSQVDGSAIRRFGGSGLGLTITRRLAEMMDGHAGFRSTQGVGSTFWFEVLAPEAAEPAGPEPVALAETALEGVSILLVEDNPTNRLVASKLLESVGAEVETAVDGVEGVEAVRRRAYDVVLMDVQMPRMGGVEAARRIRALGGRAAATPIIALTANVMSDQRADYLAAGMDDVAGKPISIAALLAQIAQVLNGRDQARPLAETA